MSTKTGHRTEYDLMNSMERRGARDCTEAKLRRITTMLVVDGVRIFSKSLNAITMDMHRLCSRNGSMMRNLPVDVGGLSR